MPIRDNTINLNEVMIVFNQDCDCVLPDPDDCLLITSVVDHMNEGVICCSVCGRAYTYDEVGLILVNIPG